MVVINERDLIWQKIKIYEKDLSRLCVFLCRNTTEAEDLYQETWLKVIRNYDKYDENRPFEKWLHSVCINTFKNMRKSSIKRHELLFSSEEEENFYLSSIPGKNISHDLYICLYEAISRLPDKYRLVIILKYFRDYSEKDIAEILKIPAGTVKSRLHKAKKFLMEDLA